MDIIIDNDFTLEYERFFSISRTLDFYGEIFYKIWEFGEPVFTRSIPTSAITFDKTGNYVSFLFNPDFFKSKNDEELAFIISHECMHSILNHGKRSVDIPHSQKMNANMSMDVVINELLVKSYGFQRTIIDPNSEFCWLNTIFPENREKLKNSSPEDVINLPHDKNIHENESFEYYYNRISDNSSEKGGSGSGELVDDHSFFGQSEMGEGFIDKLQNSLSNEGKKQLENSLKNNSSEFKKSRGAYPGTQQITVPKKHKVVKRKWETIIRRWLRRASMEFDDQELWMRKNRRNIDFNMGIEIPNIVFTMDANTKKKIKVSFFLDTSGSCINYAERFWKAAESVPRDRFDISLYCFDTEVYKTNLNSRKLFGFGGTLFSPIESHLKNMSRYPDAVFVLTDGFGDKVEPKHPHRWHVFLTEYNTKSCFSTISKNHFYELKDFE